MSNRLGVATLDLCKLGFYFHSHKDPVIKKLKTLGFLILVYLHAFPQSSPQVGARAMGMGYTASCLKDEWSVFNNSAGLADIKSTTAGFSYNVHPHFKFFNRPAFTLALPTKLGVAAIGVSRMGDDILSEQVASAAFANQFGLAALGLKVNLIQINAEGFGSRRVVTASFGGQASLTKHLTIAAHITNLNNGKLTDIDDSETLPTYLTIGVGVKPSEKLILSTEVEKDLTEELILRAGLEYRFHPKFIMRSGFSFNPEAGFFGIGCKGKRFSFDYALQYNTATGISYELTTGVKLKRR